MPRKEAQTENFDRLDYKADASIRKHRTANVTVTVFKKDHTPLTHQEIVVAQRNHKFLLGCTGFEIIPLANGELVGAAKARAEQLNEKLSDLFNFITLPFYWGRFEPQRGHPDTRRLINSAQWLVERGIPVKGHPLCWHTVTADWLMEMNNTDIIQAQVARIQREVADFAGLIDMWDVINEVVIMPIYDKYDNGITRICRELGRFGTIRTMFEAARSANPSAILLLNDFDVSPAYEILIEGCLEAGIKIDVIGIQSHMHQGYWGVDKTLAILDRFARLQPADSLHRKHARLRPSHAAGDRGSQRLSGRRMAHDARRGSASSPGSGAALQNDLLSSRCRGDYVVGIARRRLAEGALWSRSERLLQQARL